MGTPRGRGDTLIFSYVGSGHFFGFKILNFVIFGGFQKNEYFLGYEDFVDIFGVHYKIGLSFLCILGCFFLRSRCRMGDIFWGW